MKLTPETYHSVEANREYLSVSQIKDFCGTMAMRGCERYALARINGEWEVEKTPALLVGGYVDASFEGTLDVFKAQNPQIFTQKGELKAEYKMANDIISRVERDPYWMKFMSGEKQVIFTGELFGAKWKIKIDSLIRNVCLVDLKVMRDDIRRSFWVKDLGQHVSWLEYWDYTLQAAVYQEITRQNLGDRLPFYIAAVTKEKHPDHEIIGFTDAELSDRISLLKPNIARILSLKNGEEKPEKCGVCDWCKEHKTCEKPVHFSELLLSI